MQIPIGLEEKHVGVIDLLKREAVYFKGDKGTTLITEPVPETHKNLCEEKRKEIIEKLADIDDEIAEQFINEINPSVDDILKAVRRQTVARKFVPVFMGSAFKNKGVQLLLDGVINYLPSPAEVENIALDLSKDEATVPLSSNPKAPLVALAFKLEESKYGQLTYIRIYQGSIHKGMVVTNTSSRKKVKVPRIVRMHSNEMEEVDSAGAGDVVAVFGVECASMDTFTDGSVNYSMISMFVPKPVMSLSVKPKESGTIGNFSKAVGKFTREDPTLHVTVDDKTQETIMSGMGELHLEVYIERLKREYGVECVTGSPNVSYKETVTARSPFSYLHKKQSGGSGQYARVVGYVEPLEEELVAKGVEFEFENRGDLYYIDNYDVFF
jgi:elongation factor G